VPEQFTGDARQVVVCASEQARRLGHGFIGGEHLLYGLAPAGGEVGAVLRERGVTPERVEAEFVRLIGPENTASGSLFDTLDRDALTTIGIDLDTVRERIEAAFGPAALAPDAPAPRRWRRSRPGRGPGRVTGHIPLTRRAKKCLESSLREAQAHSSGHLGAEHIALALLAMDDGVPHRILSVIGASAPLLVPRSATATDRPADAGHTARQANHLTCRAEASPTPLPRRAAVGSTWIATHQLLCSTGQPKSSHMA
jgi:ATP-dependent Clp protease ATP-binding subunit ClpA